MVEIVPTGIDSFDMLIGGGFPRGSVVLLMGGFDTGQDEFLITSAERIAARRKRETKTKNVFIPKKTVWATVMRHSSDILHYVSTKFHPEFNDNFSKGVGFEDFFSDYARETPSLPREILNEITSNDRKKQAKDLEEIARGALAPSSVLLDSLTKMFKEKAPGSMVVLDSLTDLARLFRNSNNDWNALILFLNWIKRSSRDWGGITYMLLNKGLLDERMENELLTCFSDILLFRSEVTSQGEIKALSVRKFSGGATGEIGEARLRITARGLEVERLKLIERLA